MDLTTSVFLARVIGLFGAISVFGILAHYKENLAIEEKAARNPTLLFLSSFVAIFLGVLVVVSHQVWTADWRVVITILGWAMLLKGVLRLFFPQLVLRLIEKKRRSRRFWIAEVVFAALCLYLLYQGFVVY